MLTVLVILVIAAFLTTIASSTGHCQLWVGVVLLCIIEMLRILPLG
jgi:hypothetical protein